MTTEDLTELLKEVLGYLGDPNHHQIAAKVTDAIQSAEARLGGTKPSPTPP